jgi:ligand-binding SRPBCC domain-containing protein
MSARTLPAPPPATHTARSLCRDNAVPTLIVAARFTAPPEKVFEFHADARNLERLSRPPVRFYLIDAPYPTRQGDLQVFRIGLRPLTRRWHARIVAFDPGHSLTDVQEEGPFAYWRHSHVVFPDGAGTMLIDYVEFASGRSLLARLFDRLVLLPLLRRAFADRHRRTRALLTAAP